MPQLAQNGWGVTHVKPSRSSSLSNYKAIPRTRTRMASLDTSSAPANATGTASKRARGHSAMVSVSLSPVSVETSLSLFFAASNAPASRRVLAYGHSRNTSDAFISRLHRCDPCRGRWGGRSSLFRRRRRKISIAQTWTASDPTTLVLNPAFPLGLEMELCYSQLPRLRHGPTCDSGGSTPSIGASRRSARKRKSLRGAKGDEEALMTLPSRPCAPSSLIVRGIFTTIAVDRGITALLDDTRGGRDQGRARGNPTNPRGQDEAQSRSTCWGLECLFQRRSLPSSIRSLSIQTCPQTGSETC